MAKPMLRGIPAFDASNGYGIGNSVTILYSGSAVSNKIYVYEADTNRRVINGTQNTGLNLIIPANTLSNNKQYYIGVTVTDDYGNVSELSDYVFFSCYSTPVFRFSNVTNGQHVTRPVLDAKLQYSQAQNRGLMSYIFYLYEISASGDSGETSKLIYTSNTYYDNSLECTFRGLEATKSYYIQAKGNTVDNMVIDTGLVRILADFIQPNEDYYILKVENNPVCGWISYKTNVHIVEGEFWEVLAGEQSDVLELLTDPNESDPNDFSRKIIVYEENKGVSNSYVDCTSGLLIYKSGWNCPKDFMLRVNFKDLYADETWPMIRMVSTDGYEIKIYFNEYDDNGNISYRFRLVANNGLAEYVLYSRPIIEPVLPVSGSFSFNRINDLYSMSAFNILCNEIRYSPEVIANDTVGM